MSHPPSLPPIPSEEEGGLARDGGFSTHSPCTLLVWLGGGSSRGVIWILSRNFLEPHPSASGLSTFRCPGREHHKVVGLWASGKKARSNRAEAALHGASRESPRRDLPHAQPPATEWRHMLRMLADVGGHTTRKSAARTSSLAYSSLQEAVWSALCTYVTPPRPL